MFCNNYDESILQELPKCLRVMPHHQNTSGFFITVFEKLEECDNINKIEKDPKDETLKNDGGKLPL